MATEVKRGAGVAMFVALVLAMAGLGYGVATASGQLGGASAAPTSTPTSPPRTPTEDAVDPSPQPAPQAPPRQELPVVTPTPSAPARLFGPGDTGHDVRVIQSRLREIQWFAGKVTDTYGPATESAVRGFQAKRGFPVTGEVDARTLRRLERMTHEPTADELANKISDGTWTDAPLDPRCTTGRALCIDKTSRTIRWVLDGAVQKTMAVRFGSSYTPTREGLFHVESKSRDHVSSLFGSAMPFAMFFSRGQAVHYSSDFAARGYSGASHGCVNVRDYDGLRALFDQVEVGDKVVVYWS